MVGGGGVERGVVVMTSSSRIRSMGFVAFGVGIVVVVVSFASCIICVCMCVCVCVCVRVCMFMKGLVWSDKVRHERVRRVVVCLRPIDHKLIPHGLRLDEPC